MTNLNTKLTVFWTPPKYSKSVVIQGKQSGQLLQCLQVSLVTDCYHGQFQVMAS